MDVGIYKWISPTGRIYVGQSKNLKQRKEWYLSNGIKQASMPKLKRSFEKYGIENHIFEIIEYCSLDKLDEREIHWGLYYNTLEKGLNCKLGEQNSIFSEETKFKMSKAKQGFKLSPKSEAKRQTSLRKVWDNKNNIREEKNKNKPKYTPTKEHKENISKSKLGKPVHTEESKQKLREYGKTRDLTKAWQATSKSQSKPILQYSLEGEFIKEWASSNDAELYYRGKRGDNIGKTIRHYKKTGVQWKAYGFIWKQK
jgi:group I intron endonuclease